MDEHAELLNHPHVSLREAAELCGVDRKTIRRWHRAGRIRLFKIVGRARVPVADLERLVEPGKRPEKEPARVRKSQSAWTQRVLEELGVR